MRYKIIVQREKEYDNVEFKGGVYQSTVGTFTIYDTERNNDIIFKCYSVECPGPSTDKSKQKKRIMPRTYKLKWKQPTSVTVPKEFNDSKKGKRAPHLYTDELPKFEDRAILIHIANVGIRDVIGCIGIGNKDEKNGLVLDSTTACKSLFELFDKLGIENFELEVREIEYTSNNDKKY